MRNSEFISKNRIFDLIHAVNSVHGFTSYEDYVGLLKDVETSTNADVQLVKHGRWSECYTDSRLYSGICTVCGGAAIRSVKGKPLDYCPNCGARMDGDAE